jgi:hypothetical protein
VIPCLFRTGCAEQRYFNRCGPVVIPLPIPPQNRRLM